MIHLDPQISISKLSVITYKKRFVYFFIERIFDRFIAKRNFYSRQNANVY